MLNPHVFRAYDVRGVVGRDINPDVFRQVGRAYGTLIRRKAGRRVAVGQDNRASSETLKAGFVEGVRAAGVDVVDVGVVPTPILYFAAAHWKLDGGANITGSHNPIAYNGVKMVHRGAAPLTEEEIQLLRTLAERGDFEQGHGTLDARSPRDDYFTTVGGMIRLGRRLTGVVDERGRRHEADLILVLLARDFLKRHPGAKVVFDVKSSQSLIDDIRAHGGVPVMWKTGHSHLKRKMREEGILLGGEVSGHMFFAENYYGVDDGILASCKIIETAARSPEPISRLFDSVEHLCATPELKAPCPDGEKFRVIEELTRELKARYPTIDTDGARVLFPGGGWGLVRASNTNPYLTLRFEAQTEREIEDMKRVIYDALRRYPFVTLPS